MAKHSSFHPFLLEAVTHIASQGHAWQDVVVVLPSKRARIFFMQHLQGQITGVHLAPALWSIEGFIAELAGNKIAPLFHQLHALFVAYQKHVPKSEQEDFAAFLQWAPRLLKDLNDIDAYGLDVKEVLTFLAGYYALEKSGDDSTKPRFSSEFWKQLLNIFHSFKATLLEQGFANMGMLYREALDVLTLYLEQTTKHHFFVGFNALNASEEILFQEFLVAEKGEVLWDLDQCFYDDSSHAAGRFIRQYQHEWTHYRQHPSVFKSQNFTQEKKIEIIGVTGDVPQAQEVHSLLEKEQLTPKTTAVILGNESLLLPVLGALPETITAWNVTLGYPIENLPISRFFLQYIHLYNTQGEEGFSRDTVSDVLSFSPFLAYLSSQGIKNVHVKWKKLQHQIGGSLSHTEWASFLPNHWPRFSVDDKKVALQFCSHLVELAEGILPFIDTSIAKSGLLSFRQLLLQLHYLIAECNFFISLSALKTLIEEGLGQQNIDFKGDPIQGLQIMGMLESRVLDFETVILTHVNEGNLPMGKNDQSFFPFALKKQFGLPTFLDNDAIYSYHFYRLLQRAKKVYLLYNTKSEGFGAGEKSRFIHQLKLFPQSAHQVSERLSSQELPPPSVRSQSVTKTPMMLSQLKAIALRGFSPTSLSAYFTDPLTFYHRYLLGVSPMVEQQNVMSHLRRGELVHKALETLYTPYVNTPMLSDCYTQMISVLPQVLESCYVKHYALESKEFGENALLYAAYMRAIEQHLKVEQEKVKNGNTLVIRGLEQKFSCSLEGFDFPVHIQGTIDRIDEYNGQLRLVDYKTGAVEMSKLLWSTPEVFWGDYKRQPLFQLLLYSWAMHRMEHVVLPIQAGVLSLKTPTQGVLPVRQKTPETPANKFMIDQPLLVEFEDFLRCLIKEIFAEQKSFVSLE